MSSDSTNDIANRRLKLESELSNVDDEIKLIEQRIGLSKPLVDKKFLFVGSATLVLAIVYLLLGEARIIYPDGYSYTANFFNNIYELKRKLLFFTEFLGFLCIAVPILVFMTKIPRPLLFILIGTAVMLAGIRIADHAYWTWFNSGNPVAIPDGIDDRYDTWLYTGEIFAKKSPFLVMKSSKYVISAVWLMLLVLTLYTIYQNKKGKVPISGAKATLFCIILLLVGSAPASASFFFYKNEWKTIDKKLLQTALKPFLELKNNSWMLHELNINDGFRVSFDNPYVLYADEFGELIYIKQKLKYYYKGRSGIPVSGDMNLVTKIELESFRKNTALKYKEMEFRSADVGLILKWKDGQKQFECNETGGYDQMTHQFLAHVSLFAVHSEFPEGFLLSPYKEEFNNNAQEVYFEGILGMEWMHDGEWSIQIEILEGPLEGQQITTYMSTSGLGIEDENKIETQGDVNLDGSDWNKGSAVKGILVSSTGVFVGLDGGNNSTQVVWRLKELNYNGPAFSKVNISGQIWMADNLNVGTFRNGDPIPQAKTNEEWLKAGANKQPAWCYFANDPKNGEMFGKLYNWYAVNDPRVLAPFGWHIPSDEEWSILENYLGDEGGTKMKSTSGWQDNGNGTNSSSFSGLPGGVRYGNGTFYDFGTNGYWWSTTEYNTSVAWGRDLGYNKGKVGRSDSFKYEGLSVRCLRD